MKKSEIKKEAEKLMKNRNVDVVFATSDGQLFLEKNSADLHQETNAKGEKLTIFKFGAEDAPEAEAKAPANDMNAKDTIALVATVDDPAQLDLIQKEEEAGKNRKSVLDAIGSRNAALVKDGGDKNDDERKNDDN